MSIYFLDTEFLEGTQERPLILKGRLGNWMIGKPKPTIDLISIGIVCEDGREYYAISKDFNLKEAWNRYDVDLVKEDHGFCVKSEFKKVYWIRENVLLPMYTNFVNGDMRNHIPFTYSTMKRIIESNGKSNAQIAQEVKVFVYNQSDEDRYEGTYKEEPKFYGYFSDYDWVVFCWLFGKMIDLPKGFPMYCIDLKQELQGKIDLMKKYKSTSTLNLSYINFLSGKNITLGDATKMDWDKWIKDHPNYPKQTNEHNALSDAKFCKDLYVFIQSL